SSARRGRRMRFSWRTGVFAAAVVAIAMAMAAPAAAQSRFQGWSSAIIAADWRDGQGQPIGAFENARRDLSRAFVAAGFDPALMPSLSLRPDAEEPVAATEALEALRRMGQT